MGRLKIGPGGAVTQATNKSTAVTLNRPSGQITMNGAALASSTSVGFTVNNSIVDADDHVSIAIGATATANSYFVGVDAIGAGSFHVHVRNISGGSLSEALVLNFIVVKNNPA